MKNLRWLLVPATLLLASPLWAQDTPSGELRERTYDFADDVVEGELVRPDGELIEGQIHGMGSSLITIRQHFIDKMIESVEDL
ncbi:MAG: hypothetical protein JW797_13225 [Bradymonadales bacterium]|nr:hypothetical protein [Bradymonadales bacterium]